MKRPSVREPNWGRRVFVAAAALVSLGAPVAIGVLHAPRLRAQEASAPRFEVASVKLHKKNDGRDGDFRIQPGGRLVANGMPLYLLIQTAYGVSSPLRMTGGRIGSDSEEYDIDARPEKGAAPATFR